MISIIILFCLSFFIIKFIIKKEKTYIFCFFLPYFIFAWKAMSLIYLEAGTYSPEIAQNTYRINSDLIFLSIMTLFWIFSIYFIRFIDKRTSTANHSTNLKLKYDMWFRKLHCVVLVYLYLNVMLTGSALTNNNINRFNFFQMSKLPYISILVGSFSDFLLFIDGVIYFRKGKRKNLSLVLYIFSILYQILMGNKFSGIFQHSVFFFSPYLIYNVQKNGDFKIRNFINKKSIIAIGLIVTLFICTLYLGYFDRIKNNENFWEIIFDRTMNLQSGTLWGVCNYVNNNGIALFGDKSQFITEIHGIISGTDEFDKNTGLIKVMFLISPSYIVENYISNSIRFSGWFLVVSILSMGYVGSALYVILLAYIFAVICVSLISSIRQKNIIMTGLSIYAYMQFYDYYRIGNFNLLFNFPVICLLIVLMFYLRLLMIKKYNTL